MPSTSGKKVNSAVPVKVSRSFFLLAFSELFYVYDEPLFLRKLYNTS